MDSHNRYWKIARPDGWDFYTGKTINYRDSIGQFVRPPDADTNGSLCSSAFIHASDHPNKCFVRGTTLPCSVYRVEGIPALSDKDKSGFTELMVLEELAPEDVFAWRYKDAINPLNPLTLSPPAITPDILGMLNVWASVFDSVWVSVGASVWASVRASVRASVWASVGACV